MGVPGQPENAVALVIPGRNAAKVLPFCLDAAVQQLDKDGLSEIIVIDDGSTDDTAAVVARYPVRSVRGEGGGPGYARNLGWRAASAPIVWFIDADCVVNDETLARLLGHLDDPAVAGAGGTYTNQCPGSLLACLIQEEIAARHQRMSPDVDYLATFNVVYRRSVLDEVGGFDEGRVNGPGSPGAEDIELAFRVNERGYRLRFEPRSSVGHFHPTSLRRYLRSQRHHGYYRVWLYFDHRGRARGDAYSGLVDHVQPPLAMLVLASLPLLFIGQCWLVPLVLVAGLLALQAPMAVRLTRGTGNRRMLVFALLGFVRSFARGIGMSLGLFAWLWRPRTGVKAHKEVAR